MKELTPDNVLVVPQDPGTPLETAWCVSNIATEIQCIVGVPTMKARRSGVTSTYTEVAMVAAQSTREQPGAGRARTSFRVLSEPVPGSVLDWLYEIRPTAAPRQSGLRLSAYTSLLGRCAAA